MYSNHDEILNQLTNIGGGYQYSPVKTPVAENSSEFENSKKSTPSPFSRNKSWTSKLAKFQLSNSRKKKTPTQSPASISSQELNYSEKTNQVPSITPIITPSSQYPTRISSLPRPNSMVFHQNSRKVSSNSAHSNDSNKSQTKKNVPKQQMPFQYTKLTNLAKKSFLNESCTLCEESISNRTNGERVIQLECGHVTHQECLTISFGNSNNYDKTDIYSLFPVCAKCKVERFKSNRCIPNSDEIKDRLVSDFLIGKNSITAQSLNQLDPEMINELMSPLPSPIQEVERKSMYQSVGSPVSSFESHRSVSPINRGGMSLMNPPSGPRNRSNFGKSYSRIGSTIVASSSIHSSADDHESIFSEVASSNFDPGNDEEDKIPLPLIRSYFVEMLVNNFEGEITKWTCDDNFGLLRLVDKLSVSENGSDYTNCQCFLFEKSMVIAEINEENNAKPNNDSIFLGTSLINLKIYICTTGIKVETRNSSVLKVTINNGQNSKPSSLYLTENIDSISSKVIQKWISGLLDSELLFNESNFTSTLSLPTVIQNLGDEEEKSTFVGLISPNKIVEVARLENNRESTIIRRGITVFSGIENGTNMDTLQTMMTSVSSILSLKRERPEGIVIILQLDFRKLKDDSYIIIYNSLQALVTKYPNLIYCTVDADGFVVQYGQASKDILNLQSIYKMNKPNAGIKFSPTWLKNTIYPLGITSSLGIAILSNGSMEEARSCLLMDYKIFASPGRRHANELKIKVGYLNSDYSDKITELVEIGTWAFMLEALCYSFSLSFEDDDDDEDEDDAGDDRDYYDDYSSINSDEKSITTLLIHTPLDGTFPTPVFTEDDRDNNSIVNSLQIDYT
ncbi:hypothetical protein Kpol_1061p54, partial [Vanderwaltozyma polyspora DSM 70294]